jgi:hypothetical protein
VDWDTTHDPGLQVVEFAYRTMGIDDEWSIREPRGFTWWGHRLAQRVWAEPARTSEGFEVYRVHAETALLRDVGDHENLSESLAVLNQFASLNAYVWNPAARRLFLRCSVNVHTENVPWLRKIFGAAVGIQAADAHIKVGLAKMLGGEPDFSTHPRNGPREEPDDMLRIIEVVAKDGEDESPFAAAEFASVAQELGAHKILAFGGEDGEPALSAEFPFYDNRPAIMTDRAGTALLIASAQERHTQLGSGVLLRLILPQRDGSRDLGQLAELAHELNRAEAREWAASHFLGAWCAHSKQPVSGISFVTFVPGGVHAPGLLRTFILNCGLRARWAKEYLDRSSNLPIQEEGIDIALDARPLANPSGPPGGYSVRRPRAASPARADIPSVRCWRCKKTLPVSGDNRGSRIKCPGCGAKQQLPL